MAKYVNDLVYDAAIDYIKNNATEEYLCSSQPTTRATAISAALATKTGLTSGSFTGAADGDISGRKVTINAQSGLTIDVGGTATHVALCSATQLLMVHTCTSQVVTAGNTVTIPAHKLEIADVTP